MKRKIMSISSSLLITLPKQWCSLHSIEKGDFIDIKMEDDHLIIKRALDEGDEKNGRTNRTEQPTERPREQPRERPRHNFKYSTPRREEPGNTDTEDKDTTGFDEGSNRGEELY